VLKLDLSTLPVKPAGFGHCAVCAYRETGTPALCFTCARERLERLSATKCKICDRPLSAGETCSNPICSSGDRQFQWNYAVAMRSGHLQNAINSYKYQDKKEWAQIFARVLVGFLDEEAKTFSQFNLIVASPSYLSQVDGRVWDHTRRVTELAYTFSGGRWPFDIGDRPAIIKTAATSKMTGNGWAERKYIAQTDLRDALAIPNPQKTAGKVILVYDDVFTGGLTLNEIARCLKEKGGSRAVCGVTLARQPVCRQNLLDKLAKGLRENLAHRG